MKVLSGWIVESALFEEVGRVDGIVGQVMDAALKTLTPYVRRLHPTWARATLDCEEIESVGGAS